MYEAVKAKKADRQLYSSKSESNQYPEGKEGRKWTHNGILLKANKAEREVNHNQ